MAEGQNKQGWLGGPHFIRIKRWGSSTSNSGPVGKRNRRPYHLLIRAGAENAKAKGLLFGRHVDKTSKQVAIPDRGKAIWPDPPRGMMRQWWRAHQTGRFLNMPIPRRSVWT